MLLFCMKSRTLARLATIGDRSGSWSDMPPPHTLSNGTRHQLQSAMLTDCDLMYPIRAGRHAIGGRRKTRFP
jgi:hypothetical protein